MENSKKLKEYSLCERAEFTRLEGLHIAERIRASSSDRVVQGLADKMERCNAAANLWTADDLHNADGEAFAGRGSLCPCNSRLCPQCVGRLSRRNRKIMRTAMQHQKLLVGTDWRFITLTMPDMSLQHLDLLTVRGVINAAWRKFSRSRWFESRIKGGAKSEEFTIGNYSQIHYHLHLLAVTKSFARPENLLRLRSEWTAALIFAFEKYNLPLDIQTSDGFAVCHVVKVSNREKALLEVAKYITKSDSLDKLPSCQLAQLATIERMPRMFELFGTTKETARVLAEKSLTSPANVKNASCTNSENSAQANKDTYVHTQNITVENSAVNYQDSIESSGSRAKVRLTWRDLCRILPREDWLTYLDDKIDACRAFRKVQLRLRFPVARFTLLTNETF